MSDKHSLSKVPIITVIVPLSFALQPMRWSCLYSCRDYIREFYNRCARQIFSYKTRFQTFPRSRFFYYCYYHFYTLLLKDRPWRQQTHPLPSTWTSWGSSSFQFFFHCRLNKWKSAPYLLLLLNDQSSSWKCFGCSGSQVNTNERLV